MNQRINLMRYCEPCGIESPITVERFVQRASRRGKAVTYEISSQCDVCGHAAKAA